MFIFINIFFESNKHCFPEYMYLFAFGGYQNKIFKEVIRQIFFRDKKIIFY